MRLILYAVNDVWKKNSKDISQKTELLYQLQYQPEGRRPEG